MVRLYQPKQKKGTKLKLSRNWTGPWMIIKRLSNILYQIQHSKTSKPKIVHADNLKPFCTRKTTQSQLKKIQMRKIASIKMSKSLIPSLFRRATQIEEAPTSRENPKEQDQRPLPKVTALQLGRTATVARHAIHELQTDPLHGPGPGAL